MRGKMIVACAGLAAAVIAGMGMGFDKRAVVVGDAAGAESLGLVAHEWGTFTTFSGSDGTPRKFWSEYAEASRDLPRYVWAWGQTGDDTWEAAPISLGMEGGKRSSQLLAMVRMETPVIYFNTARPATVDVEVRLEAGQMTEFYPPPTTTKGNKEQKAALWWKGVEIRPGADERGFPAGSGTHYDLARATDAAPVAVHSGGKEYLEKFLFYRGVADFDPRVRVKALGSGKFEVENRTGAELPAAVLVEVSGTDVRMATMRSVGAKGEAALGETKGKIDAPAEFLRGQLAAAGLTAREAEAMVNTWRASWFGEGGTRLIYILPQTEVDRVLPLRITPTPAETRRVFVGRAEVMTPEDETKLAGMLRTLGTAVVEGHDATKETAEIRRWLGRFARPAVQRVGTASEDALVRAAARRIGGE